MQLNYRVLRKTKKSSLSNKDEQFQYSLAQVYSDRGVPFKKMSIKDPEPASNLEDLKEEIQDMLAAFNKPTLDYETLTVIED
jgi:hypothetical protein